MNNELSIIKKKPDCNKNKGNEKIFPLQIVQLRNNTVLCDIKFYPQYVPTLVMQNIFKNDLPFKDLYIPTRNRHINCICTQRIIVRRDISKYISIINRINNDELKNI